MDRVSACILSQGLPETKLNGPWANQNDHCPQRILTFLQERSGVCRPEIENSGDPASVLPFILIERPHYTYYPSSVSTCQISLTPASCPSYQQSASYYCSQTGYASGCSPEYYHPYQWAPECSSCQHSAFPTCRTPDRSSCPATGSFLRAWLASLSTPFSTLSFFCPFQIRDSSTKTAIFHHDCSQLWSNNLFSGFFGRLAALDGFSFWFLHSSVLIARPNSYSSSSILSFLQLPLSQFPMVHLRIN